MRTLKAKYIGYMSKEEQESDDIDFYNLLPGADWIVYNYQTAPYEGSGVSIHKKDGKYYQSNLGHCSCYGPTENLEEKEGYDSIESLLKNCSKNLINEIQPLLDVIKAEGL